MSSNSMDEDGIIIPSPFDENNEDCTETCDDEVNDVVPRLERLRINDNELMNSPSGFSINAVSSSIKNFEGTSITDSNHIVSSTFVGDKSGEIWVKEGTKATVGDKKSLSGITLQLFSTNTHVDTLFQDVIQKMSEDREIHMDPLNTIEGQMLNKVTGVENACDERPLDLSSKRNLDRNDKALSNFEASGNKIELKSLTFASEKKKNVDPETGEITDKSDNILLDTSGSSSSSIGKVLDQSIHEMASGAVSTLDSSKLSYSADVSFDDQSDRSSGIAFDSPLDSSAIGAEKASNVKNKRSRKIGAFVPPVSGMSEIRKRRFSIFHPPSNVIDTSKTDSSDEDSKNSSVVGKQNPKNSRRKCRKTVKSSPKSIALNSSVIENEEKRPSPCKRKKTFSENTTETTGKFRKRSVSEHNTETGENTHLVIRSRSLSPGSQNIHRTSVKKTPSKNSTSQSRKRTNSHSLIITRVKLRKSSTSADDA
ncbi:unnamed protein product [Larinioides sclopetarius]|uniref:Uncharacterized protein n=1 Tax=Larinioides sclopetarius TaxID=280406 RepID=A0AAV1ZJZ5_9ARAC